MRIATQAAHVVARLIASHPTPEQIIAFHPSQAATDRLYELIEAEREHTLAPDEQQELDTYIALEYFMEMVKVEAQRKLAQKLHGEQEKHPVGVTAASDGTRKWGL